MPRKSKKDKENIPSDISDESVLDSESEKLSRRQKIVKYLLSKKSLVKILLTTETSKKSKHLWPALRPIKRKLAENFSPSDKLFQGDDVNELFRIYLNEGTDITVLSEQKKYIPQYKVKTGGISKSKEIPLHHYLSLLDHIILNIYPYAHDIKPLVKQARKNALDDHPEHKEEIFSSRESELESSHLRKSAKQHLDELLKEKFADAYVKYDQDWFMQQCKEMSSNTLNDYQELMMFAVLGFHYFKKKDAVYNAFTPEQLESQIPFDLPDYPLDDPYLISLKDLLGILEQLNFKTHLFDF